MLLFWKPYFYLYAANWKFQKKVSMLQPHAEDSSRFSKKNYFATKNENSNFNLKQHKKCYKENVREVKYINLYFSYCGKHEEARKSLIIILPQIFHLITLLPL